jgi:hypothetical protein
VFNGPHCESGKVESRNMPRILMVLLRKGFFAGSKIVEKKPRLRFVMAPRLS